MRLCQLASVVSENNLPTMFRSVGGREFVCATYKFTHLPHHCYCYKKECVLNFKSKQLVLQAYNFCLICF